MRASAVPFEADGWSAAGDRRDDSRRDARRFFRFNTLRARVRCCIARLRNELLLIGAATPLLLYLFAMKFFLAETSITLRGTFKEVRMKARLLVVTFLSASLLFAQQGKEPPFIKAYPGSELLDQEVTQFDEAIIPLGPVVQGKLSKSEKVEGKITRLQYRDPEGRSALEKVRNYEQALREAGFQIAYTCNHDAEECGSQIAIPPPVKLFPAEKRYLAARWTRPQGAVWVAAMVGSAFTKVWIVEARPMDTGMVKISAESLGKGLSSEGHIALYGIFFDTGKAVVKAESADTLKEIAVLLQKKPKLNLYVVGHTDSVGKLADNIDLSKRRAAAVVSELTTKYRVDVARLRPDGVGPLAPVATNREETGRARNRRVELVEQ